MSSSGESRASSPSSTRAARAAVLALLAEETCSPLAARYRAATIRLLDLLAAYLAAERGLALAPARRYPAIERLAAGADSPHAVLSAVYESLLRVEPVKRHGKTVMRPVRAERRRTGSYYTPRAIAVPIVEMALAGAPPHPRVLDPAMGTGVFLLVAVQHLMSGADRAAVAEQCLFGMDLDPVAVRVAVQALWLETGARREVLERHLVQGDALSANAAVQDADVVLGNPPWGAAYSSAQKRRLGERFPSAVRTSFDSAKLFVDVGSRRTQGTLGMVLPQSFLAQQKHADVRALLLERMAPRAALSLGNAFSGAAAPACGLVFGQKPGPRRVLTGSSSLPAHLWTERSFPLGDAWALSVLQRLQRQHPVLRDLEDRLRVRDVGLNYNRASVSRRSLYAAARPEHPLDRARYRGRDFRRYGPVRRGGWLRHDAEVSLCRGESLSYCRETAALANKIVLRQTADRLVATLDQTRMVMGRSVIALVVADTGWLLPVLALLNSSLVTALYRAMAGEEGRILPQVKVGRLRALPIPALVEHRSEWEQLGPLAAELLERSGDDAAADRAIDLVVARMYGLTEHEAEELWQGSVSEMVGPEG